MQVSVETLKGLERKIIISVPSEKFEEEVGMRLRNLARKVKVDGFRPGKVPFHIVQKKFSESVSHEVARDLIQPTLFDALQNNQLNPAGQPQVELEQIELGKDFKYNAVFEVFPEFDIHELEKVAIELIDAEVSDQDVEKMIEMLRAQHKNWSEVSRPVAKDDKIVLDFEGFIDGNPFEGGKAHDYELAMGQGSMIKGFEEGLIGAEQDKPLDITVTFPEDYGHQDLAGKEAVFKITVKKIMQGELPELDDTFVSKFNIKEGGIEALKKDIRDNMARELERRVNSKNREAIFNKLLEQNTIDLPMVLVDQEIANLKHEMYHRVFGHEHHENEKIPDFPRELFEEQARRRVQLGLLFSEYVKKHEIAVDKERVDAMIDRLASAYEAPEELRRWYKSQPDRLAEIETLVLEEMVSEKMVQHADVTRKTETYDAVMNPQQNKGE